MTESQRPKFGVIALCCALALLLLTPGAALAADADGPIALDVVGTSAFVGVDATVSAMVDDSTTGGSLIAGAEVSIDGGATWQPLAASDGTFDAVTEAVIGTLPGPSLTAQGDLEVCVRATDAAANVGDPTCVTILVVDPALGFVTGGGWILDPDAPLKAKNPKLTLGFVAMYQTGSTELHGSIQANLHTTKLNFHANTIELLVVDPEAGTAHIEGQGRIKVPGVQDNVEAGFRLWVVDGEPDQIHLQIFTVENEIETLVYNTGTLINLSGGNITLHAGQPSQEDVDQIEEQVDALLRQAEIDAGIIADGPLATPRAYMPLLIAQ